MLKGTNILASSGRLGRLRYFIYQFIIAIIVALIIFVVYLFINPDYPWSLVIWTAIIIPGLILSIFQTIKRLHDIDRPGWHVVLFLVPVYQIVLAILIFFKRGTEQTNDYGNSPLKKKK